MMYLDIPVNMVYQFHTTAGKIFMGGGPNLGIGSWGEIKDSEGGTSEIMFDGKTMDKVTDEIGRAHV